MILFRADANSTLGSGHVMRCLTIASVFRERDFECGFATADRDAENLIVSRGFKYYVLDSSWNNLESELPEFQKIVNKISLELLIIDHYYATERYIGSLQQFSKVAYIDDLNAFDNPADAIINYNIYATSMDYRKRYSGQRTKLLLGPTYAPLRSEFKNVGEKHVKVHIHDVLVSTGGSDPAGMCIKMLKELQNTKNCKDTIFHFIVGALNPNIDEKKELGDSLPNVVIHENVTRMDELMKMCDLAISAAGSTQYELCACGTPTVNYVLADNQIPGAEGFEKAELMINAGDCRSQENFAARLLSLTYELADNYDKRLQMSRAMQRLVDGKGAERVVDELTSMMKQGHHVVYYRN